MKFIQHYLTEELLVEISESTTLYHRSNVNDLKSGQILNPKDVQKDGKHWLESKIAEQELEKFRQEKFPDKPSRFNCIFSSVVPKARFLSKGFLYEVKPIGKIHLTNSHIIDEIDEEWAKEEMDIYGSTEPIEDPKIRRLIANYVKNLFYKYWKPESHYLSRDQVINLEVLSDTVQVVHIVDEVEDLNVGDKVEILKNITLSFYGYQKDGNTILTNYQMQKIFDNKSIQIKKGKYGTYQVQIPQGTIAKISRIRKADKNLGNTHRKYKSLDIELPGLPFTHFNIFNAKIPDISSQDMSNWKKYMRKI